MVVNLLVSITFLTTCVLFYSKMFPSKLRGKSIHNTINGDWDYEH